MSNCLNCLRQPPDTLRPLDGNTEPEFIYQSRIQKNKKKAPFWTPARSWRRERDSNPRDGCPPTRFPSVRLQPLGHLSGGAQSNTVYQYLKLLPQFRQNTKLAAIAQGY